MGKNDEMIVIMSVKKSEVEKLKEAVGFIDDVENADSDDVALAIHTLIDVCM